MEPFDIPTEQYVEKLRENLNQLSQDNILLQCRVEQLEQANHELAVAISEPMPAPPDRIPNSNLHAEAEDEYRAEMEAVEVAKDDGWDVT